MEAWEKKVLKDFGDVMTTADVMQTKKQNIIPLSPAADIGLNGGIPGGSWCNFSGPPKCGKTTQALHFAAKCQKKENGNRKVFFLDVEHRLKLMNLSSVPELDLTRFVVIRPNEAKYIISAEKQLTVVEQAIKNNPGCLVIIDSLSALCSEKELNGEISGEIRSVSPKIISIFCKKMQAVIPLNDSIVISIHHYIANTSGYGPKNSEGGGNKIQFQSDVKLLCRGNEEWKDGAGNLIGQKVKWYVKWSALGAPGSTIVNYIRYGNGIDEVTELVEIGEQLALIDKAGAWFTLDFLLNSSDKKVVSFIETLQEGDKKLKFQGQLKVSKFIEENPFIQKILYKDIKAML